VTAVNYSAMLGEQHFAAVAQGCRCDVCPLQNSGRGPVPPSLPEDYEFLVVAEAPGTVEVKEGKTLIGPSGREVRLALSNAGADTARVGYTNALYCQPPGGDLKNYLRLVKKQGLPSPLDCCRPHLDAQTERAKFVLLMGGASLQAVGQKSSVMTVRGTPLRLENGVSALATPHAAFVLRDEGRVMRPVFHADIAKAVRLSRGGNTWVDPWYFVPRSAAEIDNFLLQLTGRTAVDVETDGKDAWTCGLRRVGIGNERHVMIYSPLSVHGHYMLSGDDMLAQSRAIAAHFARSPRLDTHNGISFDSIVLARHGMTLPDDKVVDTLVGHQIGPTSELPHSLDFLASMYTDAPRWKDDVKHSEVKSDEVLDKYLSFDIATTWLCEPYVESNLTTSQQLPIYSEDMELFRIGRSMSGLGIHIDPVKRRAFAEEYQGKADRLLAEFIQIAGRDINPGSYPQIRKLLYDDLGLPMLDEHVTGSGEASTDESTLLDLLSLGVDERARKVIHGLLGYREAEKLLGTYTGHIVDGQLVGGPLCHVDGRLRPTWRPGKRSGRWGSNDPNTQNIPKKLRAMFVPAPGNVFVAADMSAVELRMIALLSNDEPLIEAFRAFDEGRGPDVHIFNACTVFRCQPAQVTDEVRNFIKRFVYALSYDAEPPRIYQTLSLLRDDNLRPLFPNITLAEVARLFAMWWFMHPAIPAWKKHLIYGWRSRGFIATQLGGRKRIFLGGERAPEMGNHDVQGSSAKLQNDSIVALTRAYPFDYVNHRGLVVNGHDQLVVECAEGEKEDVKRLVESCMQKRIGPMFFPAKANSGADWKAVS
jgi:uracil-DNA glycosylase family 4